MEFGLWAMAFLGVNLITALIHITDNFLTNMLFFIFVMVCFFVFYGAYIEKSTGIKHELYTVAQGTINGETAWWCVEGGGCVPNAFTVTAEYGGKVWYYDNSKIDFSKSGTYEHSQGLMRNDSTYVSIHYMYEIVNGQVITMTVHVAEGDQLQQ